METTQARRTIPARARPSVRYLPVALFGSVMSVAGLALAWRLANKAYGVDIAVSNGIGIVALSLFAVLALSYLVKLIRHPDLVRQEFSHPVIGNFFGTVGISVLLLSSVISGYSSSAQLLVWSIGTAFTLALSVVMISRLLNGNALASSAVPAWLIAGIGSLDIVVAGGSLTAQWTHEVNLLAAAIGGVSAIVFFVLIFSRLVHQEPLAAAMRPSKMILIAPFSVGFIAYVNLVHKVDMFAALLFYFGLFLFVIIGYRLAVKPAPFSPAWWAIGFPMAALANSALIYSGTVGGTVLGCIAALLLFLLTVAIAVLFIRTLYALLSGRLLTA
ncbi:SLAC1 anion channel family protein [Janthinobacterium agaricidamnosum]|uniref:C4-dicarboxylate transporter/malic acid transport family protein n=1 Tax=Janthinobacterium agaricidamnosum NBRC 102515 = DSM 9628 TaxID=1349767 RepID=W0V0F3_9BURK|nr:SLAC1 anion channel family protein [Janthinobacterium agaricidamnosum]CDG80813.1 C4-dicarboxylate transporter/malic acid transport family protein [Janthinobacterium agaricidamnosum NBRC 102515 = DSM 9628]